MSDFPVIAGFYRLLFMYFEPFSTILPAVMIWTVPGAGWFHHELVPDGAPSGLLDDRTTMAVWQLGNCYFLLSLLEGLGLRAVRDALPGNPVAQERIAGATLTAMAIADATHIVVSWLALPTSLRYSFSSWNGTTHGNVTFVVFLLATRLAWFAGVGRKRYYYGQKTQSIKRD
ncbi:hypothetical protein QCA50_008478 [Cerrena zonata]|uniref:DUF7704 domain-containing protein n=1 Tax=Cerrena zonata TaxID=2478898 RepID=A0AAW0G452_9APHY